MLGVVSWSTTDPACRAVLHDITGKIWLKATQVYNQTCSRSSFLGRVFLFFFFLMHATACKCTPLRTCERRRGTDDKVLLYWSQRESFCGDHVFVFKGCAPNCLWRTKCTREPDWNNKAGFALYSLDSFVWSLWSFLNVLWQRFPSAVCVSVWDVCSV